MRRTGLVFLSLALASTGAGAEPIRAVQLDLARQKESPDFVTNYMGRVRAAGYDTVVLYLEDRVKTASYPYPADADSYSPAEMSRIVRYGSSIGLDVVPVISPLGHTERFLAHKELAKFGEQCIYSPDGKFISGDGYWDETFNRHWKMVRLADNKVKYIGSFFVPEPYRDIYCRCDLHPRWRPDGKQIGFNSVHEGSRQVYVMDVR